MKSLAITELIHEAAALLLQSNQAVALTGAGISTPSGIPDFRSQDSGLWRRFDPMAVASLAAFRYQPETFFEWVRPLVASMLSAVPNPAHTSLARLEEAGLISGVVTQNIDDLHHRAGSKTVFEVHGHLRRATCIQCYRSYSTEGHIETFAECGEIPRCDDCDGILKPDIVLFGEQLPVEIVSSAQKLIDESDLILITGSSLEVTPAASMPVRSLNRGARLIIVNMDPTYLDERADVLIHADVVDVLPQLADELLNKKRGGAD
ncbi:MAG: NAD-dependent deacylase [Anaerolineales bacterium]|nr:NAD-dependent deacylase [Anaerolineales bacterium]